MIVIDSLYRNICAASRSMCTLTIELALSSPGRNISSNQYRFLFPQQLDFSTVGERKRDRPALYISIAVYTSSSWHAHA